MKTAISIVSILGIFFTFSSNAATNAPALKTEGEKVKTCFQCEGTGTNKCPVATCKNGQAPCPAPCIKLERGHWEKRPNRPDPNELMQPLTIGKRSWWVSSHHPGVIYKLKPDGTLDMQPCPVCQGSTKVECKVCKGKGSITCLICDGKKTVPESWSAFDNPKMKDRPSRFVMKDGNTLIARRAIVIGDRTTLRTADGDVQVTTSEIVREEKQTPQKP
jgi:hypothetical protein